MMQISMNWRYWKTPLVCFVCPRHFIFRKYKTQVVRDVYCSRQPQEIISWNAWTSVAGLFKCRSPRRTTAAILHPSIPKTPGALRKRSWTNIPPEKPRHASKVSCIVLFNIAVMLQWSDQPCEFVGSIPTRGLSWSESTVVNLSPLYYY